jgi:hypothetical protein
MPPLKSRCSILQKTSERQQQRSISPGARQIPYQRTEERCRDRSVDQSDYDPAPDIALLLLFGGRVHDLHLTVGESEGRTKGSKEPQRGPQLNGSSPDCEPGSPFVARLIE